MKLFLIRHAKSADHEALRRQTPTSPLGQEGKLQAQKVAQRMKEESIDTIFASKWDRARETAEYIAKAVGKDVELFDGIHEKEQNPAVYGLPIEDPIVKRYQEEVSRFERDLHWKFDGLGESVYDVIARAQAFRKHLEREHSGEDVLVVSHGIFISVFVISAILGEDFDEASFSKLLFGMSIKNTGITCMEYDRERNSWVLRYLNDHLHLKGDTASKVPYER